MMKRLGVSHRIAALSLLAAALGWLLAPSAEVPQPLVKARRDDWQLVALPRHEDGAALAAVVFSAPYWGSAGVVPVAAAASAPVDTRWRVAAIFQGGSSRGVLISFEAPDKPAQRLHERDQLPNGHRIEKIGERNVCIRVGKKSQCLGVEEREP